MYDNAIRGERTSIPIGLHISLSSVLICTAGGCNAVSARDMNAVIHDSGCAVGFMSNLKGVNHPF